MAELRPSADHRRATPPGLDRESQTGVPVDARGQSSVCAEAEVRRDHRFQPHPQGLSEPGAEPDPDCARSALEGRYYLHPATRRVRVPGGYSGRLLAPRHRLALDRTMEDELTLTALRMALSRRVVPAGLVHHSDRGSQYASNDYTDLLKANGIAISMSRKGNPWDKAYASYCTSCEPWTMFAGKRR